MKNLYFIFFLLFGSLLIAQNIALKQRVKIPIKVSVKFFTYTNSCGVIPINCIFYFNLSRWIYRQL